MPSGPTASGSSPAGAAQPGAMKRRLQRLPAPPHVWPFEVSALDITQHPEFLGEDSRHGIRDDNGGRGPGEGSPSPTSHQRSAQSPAWPLAGQVADLCVPQFPDL